MLLHVDLWRSVVPLPLSSAELAMPWPTSIPGLRITTGPHPSLGEREVLARKTVLSGACADISSIEGAVRPHEDARACLLVLTPLQEHHEQR